MLRSLLAAIVGYVVLFVLVMAGIGIGWLMLGGAGAFAGEGPRPSTGWIALNYLFGFAAALAAGRAAVRIGSEGGVRLLIGLMLVLGAWFALTAGSGEVGSEPVGKPVAEMTFIEAGEHARAPAWYNWTIPIVGVIGVALGGRRRG